MGDFGLPVLTHTQLLNELPAAPCVWGEAQRCRDQCLSPRCVQGGQHSASRTQTKQFLIFDPSTESSVSVVLMEAGGRASVLVWSQQHRGSSWLSRAAGAGSQLSADTDYPINLNLILLYPTYTLRLFCSHLNANVTNVALREVLDFFVACGEE